MFNFNLLDQSTNSQRENTILIEPTKENSLALTGNAKDSCSSSYNLKEETVGIAQN